MQPIDKSEFWEDTIKHARRNQHVVVRHAYKPIGMIIVISGLVFMEMSRLTGSLPVALLLTILIVLLMFMFS